MGTATVSDSKKAAFEQQFACSGPASPPRETKVRTVVDGVAALDKYTTGGVNFTSMTSGEMFAIIEHLKEAYGAPAEELEKSLLKVRSQVDRKMQIVDFSIARKPTGPLADRSNRPSTAPAAAKPNAPAAATQIEAIAPPAPAPAAPRGAARAARRRGGARAGRRLRCGARPPPDERLGDARARALAQEPGQARGGGPAARVQDAGREEVPALPVLGQEQRRGARARRRRRRRGGRRRDAEPPRCPRGDHAAAHRSAAH